MANLEELKKRLDSAAEIDDILDRRMLVLAVIAESLTPKGIRPVLVGGGAVEFYTAGGYATSDLDVVVDSAAEVATVLETLGFRRDGRYWVASEIDIVVETPTGPLAGDPDRVLQVRVGDMSAYVIGVEDLVIDRLNALVHWDSAEDGRWAVRLVTTHRGSLDMDYLTRRAREQNLGNALARILQDSAGSGAE